jgi:hypothetical protein
MPTHNNLQPTTATMKNKTPIGTSVAALASQACGDKGANLTDAAVTITVSQGKWRVLPAATLTANRIITLGTTGAVAGDQLTITRLDLTAFTLALLNGGAGAGTLLTLPVSKLGCATVQFDGTNWALRSFGQQP